MKGLNLNDTLRRVFRLAQVVRSQPQDITPLVPFDTRDRQKITSENPDVRFSNTAFYDYEADRKRREEERRRELERRKELERQRRMQQPLPDTPRELAPIIIKAGKKYGIPPRLLSAIFKKETSWRKEHIYGTKKSHKGASGLGQLTPITLKELERVNYGKINPNDPEQAIDATAFYLKLIEKRLGELGKNPANVLAAYNAGVSKVKKYGGVPPYNETKSYVADILRWINENK